MSGVNELMTLRQKRILCVEMRVKKIGKFIKKIILKVRLRLKVHILIIVLHRVTSVIFLFIAMFLH